MKRAPDPWLLLTSPRNLFQAAHSAAAGKRFRPDVAAFLMDLEGHVLGLRRELLAGTYQPGPYRTFVIREPKVRMISAAPFRDRVVHHALTAVLEPIFEPRFSKDSYACRKGLGTGRALARAREACARFPYVLKCDVRKYFASIDHTILKSLLARAVRPGPVLDLAGRVIDGSNPQEDAIAYFPGDDLFSVHERRRGLPLGNQTSQFFANIYLDPLDQFITRTLKPAAYARYVDDFLLFDRDRHALEEMKDRLERYLCGLRLVIHPRKSRVYRTADGVRFLGFRLFPGHTRLVRGNVIRFRQRLRAMQEAYSEGRLGWNEARNRICAWIGHARHGDTWRLRESVLSGAAFSRERRMA